MKTTLERAGSLALLGSLLLAGLARAWADDFTYGRHAPNGEAAVGYIYGPDGCWRDTSGLQYVWNFYPQYGTPQHPTDSASLVAYSNGNNLTTCRDANGHLLFDFNHVGDIGAAGGGAFFEHNGRGPGGVARGGPFTNFWFDDNWLARFMSQAYAEPLPNGLSDYSDFTRWRVLSGDANWSPYFGSAFDQLALDGLYFLTTGQPWLALSNWYAIQNGSGATYDGANQQFTYPGFNDTYHAGLALILAEQLLASPSSAIDPARQELLQHAVALRSFLLDRQESDGTNLLSWRTGLHDTTSLINIETTTCSVLALGAGARLVFEPGTALYQNPSGFYMRPYHALSAVAGLSQPGFMTYGPYQKLDPGTYTADFTLRAPGPSGAVCYLDVNDEANLTVLASRVVNDTDLAGGNEWTRVSVTFTVTNPTNTIELRTFWYGGSNLDVSAIRVR